MESILNQQITESFFFIGWVSNCNLLNLKKRMQEEYRDFENRKKQKKERKAKRLAMQVQSV